MRKKNLLAFALFTAMSLALVGCGGSSSNEESKTPSSVATEAPSNEPTDAAPEETPEATPTVEATPTATPTPTEEVKEVYSYEFSKVDGVSDKVGDFENPSFAVNGKVYTIGKSTLNDMIKDGTITEDDVDKNVGTLKSEQYTMSSVVMLHLSDGISCQYLSIRVGNFSGEELDVKDCVIQGISLDTRMFDGAIDMSKYEVNIGVSFDSTREEIESANADGKYNETLKQTEYTHKSEKYLGGSHIYYKYDDNDTLKKYEVTWMP